MRLKPSYIPKSSLLTYLLLEIAMKKTLKLDYKYKTQYRGNSSDIHYGIGDQYLIVLTIMVP